MNLKNQKCYNLTDQEILFLYYRNKQDLEEYIKFISSDEDDSLKIIKDPHYKICRSFDNRFKVIVDKIQRKTPDLYEKIMLTLNSDELF